MAFEQPVRLGREQREARPLLTLTVNSDEGENRLAGQRCPILPPCSRRPRPEREAGCGNQAAQFGMAQRTDPKGAGEAADGGDGLRAARRRWHAPQLRAQITPRSAAPVADDQDRKSTRQLQSLMRHSYAVLRLKNTKKK